MKKCGYMVVCLLLAVGLPSVGNADVREEKGLERLFAAHGLAGSILVYNQAENTYVAYNSERCGVGFLPASTFKIPNSLIALEEGIVTVDTVFRWNGEKRDVAAWERDMTLEQAFRLSCVPVYQSIARSIGVERMQQYVSLLEYGDMRINAENIDCFWLEGESNISQYQQIDFLVRLYEERLPLSASTMQTVKRLMLQEETPAYRLSGKTGLAARVTPSHGWFVGYVEKGDNRYFFATNLTPAEGAESNVLGAARVALTKDALTYLGILGE